MAFLVAGGVLAVVFVLFVALRGGGGGGGSGAHRFPPGTRAFESEMSLGILARMIEARERQLAGSPDDATREDLEKQIANMRKQAKLHRAVIDRQDVSPGKMSIGVNPDADTIE